MNELFSERCVDTCFTSRVLAAPVCNELISLGVDICPGAAQHPDAGVASPICSLPLEIVERLAQRSPGIPPSILMTGALGLMQGHIGVRDLPPATPDPRTNIVLWAPTLRTLERKRFPDGQL